MKKRAICATLLAMGSAVALGGLPAQAAPQQPCDRNDDLISDVGHEDTDLNGNDLICAGNRTSHAPKKPGPPTSLTVYYDDRV